MCQSLNKDKSEVIVFAAEEEQLKVNIKNHKPSQKAWCRHGLRPESQLTVTWRIYEGLKDL